MAAATAITMAIAAAPPADAMPRTQACDKALRGLIKSPAHRARALATCDREFVPRSWWCQNYVCKPIGT